MSDILIVHQFENMIINVFGMHFDFIILHVSTIMEVPLLGVQIGPCLKCQEMLLSARSEILGRSGSCCQRALSARNQRQWSDYNAIRHSHELSVLLELELFVCTKCAAHDAWRGNYSNHFPFWNLPTT